MSADDQITARTILQRAARASAVGRLHHAWMLTGIELGALESLGISLARQFLCMTQDQEPELGGCGACQSCKQYDAGTHPDRFELESASGSAIKVDAVRRREGCWDGC